MKKKIDIDNFGKNKKKNIIEKKKNHMPKHCSNP